MADRSLLDDLTRTLGDIDALAERHAAAHDTAATQERLAFLHQRLQTLHQDLLALRASAAHVAGGADRLAETHALLRSWEPKTLRSPAQALGHAHLDLLSLVEYTGAAIALVRERRIMLERSLTNVGGANGITAAQEDSQVRAVGDNNCADPAD